MYKKIKNSIFLIFATIIISCQAIYDPELDEGQKKIPVIQGLITTDSVSYTIRVYWAPEYHFDLEMPIKNANVYIIDDLGNNYKFTEQRAGHYISNINQFIGTPGRGYLLNVKFETGERYKSEMVFMNEQPVVDSIFAVYDTIKKYYRDFYDKIISWEETGLSVYINVSNNTNEQRFYRFSTVFLSQIAYSNKWYAVRTTIVDELPVIKKSVLYNNKQMVLKNATCFLPYYDDSPNYPDTSYGWIVIPEVYSLSQQAFEYYKAINKQLSGEQSIFDPIPSQIKGNIKCVDDTTKPVYGYFEVSSKITKTTGFYYNPVIKTIKADLPEYTKTFDTAVWNEGAPPPEWSYFYKNK